MFRAIAANIIYDGLLEEGGGNCSHISMLDIQ